MSERLASVGRHLIQALFALCAVLAGFSITSTTALASPTYSYDVPTTTRVEVHEFDDASARSALLSDVWDGSASASASVDARGTPMTACAAFIATEAASPGLSGVSRTGSALKTDAQHAFPDVVDNFASGGSKFLIPTKGPGGVVVRNSDLFQVEGSLNGKSGVFEWIVDQGDMAHQGSLLEARSRDTQPGAHAMTTASFLASEGLLDWPTALVGFRRGWMTLADVGELATMTILHEEATATCDMAELASAAMLSTTDVDDRLAALAERDSAVDEETAKRRWLLARLIDADHQRLSDEVLLVHLQEIYAEFGFPEELRYVSPYNLTFEEWVGEPQVGGVTSSPLAWLGKALRELRVSLAPRTEDE